jgi:hypothetical protein
MGIVYSTIKDQSTEKGPETGQVQEQEENHQLGKR